jgi:hypothetical protein
LDTPPVVGKSSNVMNVVHAERDKDRAEQKNKDENRLPTVVVVVEVVRVET